MDPHAYRFCSLRRTMQQYQVELIILKPDRYIYVSLFILHIISHYLSMSALCRDISLRLVCSCLDYCNSLITISCSNNRVAPSPGMGGSLPDLDMISCLPKLIWKTLKYLGMLKSPIPLQNTSLRLTHRHRVRV